MQETQRPLVIPLVGLSGSGRDELADWLAPRLEAACVDADERQVEPWETVAEVRSHVEQGLTTIVCGKSFARPGELEALCAAVLDAGGICVPFYLDCPAELAKSRLAQGGRKGGGCDVDDEAASFAQGFSPLLGVRLDATRSVEENGEQLLRLFY
jgi:hypothetical protein